MSKTHVCEEPTCKTLTYFRFCWFHSNAHQECQWQKRLAHQPPVARDIQLVTERKGKVE